MNIDFELPWPPTVNSYYSKGKHGMYLSRKGRLFKEAVMEELVQQLSVMPRIADKVSVYIVLYAPDKRVRDVDNYIKATFDALTKAELWCDDSQVDQMFVFRGEVIKHGKVIVAVRDSMPIVPNGIPIDSLINSL